MKKAKITVDIPNKLMYNKKAVNVKTNISMKEAEYPLSPAAITQTGTYIQLIQSSFKLCIVNVYIKVDSLLFTFLFYFILWRCRTISELMINEQIRDREVRLIGEDGEQLGIMPAKDAMKLAQEANLDLVKIAPTAKPPVCKIVDYGKYRYELARKEKEAKKKQKVTDVKEIRLSPNIDANDLTTKANQARKFITKGDKVKVTLRFRGREMAHMQTSKQILEDFFKIVEDVAVVEKPAKMEGRSMIMFLTEKK